MAANTYASVTPLMAFVIKQSNNEIKKRKTSKYFFLQTIRQTARQ
jgi:hypothetical protein